MPRPPPPKRNSFPKGVSGNPGGVSKIHRQIRQYASKFCKEGIDAIIAIAKNPETEDKDKLKAWQMLIDRALGPPITDPDEATQSAKGTGERIRIIFTDAPTTSSQGPSGT